MFVFLHRFKCLSAIESNKINHQENTYEKIHPYNRNVISGRFASMLYDLFNDKL